MDQDAFHSDIFPSFSGFPPFKLWENRSLKNCTIIWNSSGIQFHIIIADALKAKSLPYCHSWRMMFTHSTTYAPTKRFLSRNLWALNWECNYGFSQVDVQGQKAWLPSWMLEAKNSSEQGHHLHDNTAPFQIKKSHWNTYYTGATVCVRKVSVNVYFHLTVVSFLLVKPQTWQVSPQQSNFLSWPCVHIYTALHKLLYHRLSTHASCGFK